MKAGDVVQDRYEIERLAGSGGMGAVYRATDRSTGAPCAIKVLWAHFANQPEHAERFAREARVLQELARGRLKTAVFPFASSPPEGTRFANVVVFVVGGVTYEEAAKVDAINRGTQSLTGGAGTGAPPPFRVILGGTSVLSAKSFVAELINMRDSGHVAVDMAAGAAGSGTGLSHF